jgi:hypothetical protein
MRISILLFMLLVSCRAPSHLDNHRGSFWIQCDTVQFSGEDEETGELFLIEEVRCDTVYFDSIPPYSWVRGQMG